MGTYTKSSINRAARPRSERLRQFGGAIVSTSASVMGGGGGAYTPSGDSHTHANLADLNMITVTDGYVYLTDTYTDELSGNQVTETVKVKAGYADKAAANADGYTLDWFIPVTVNGSLTLKLNPIYTGIWSEGWGAFGGIGSSGGGGGSTVTVTQILTTGTSIATITVDGVATTLYAPANGGGGSTVAWGTVSGSTVPLTVDGTTKTLLMDGALTNYATQSYVTSQGYITSAALTGYATQTWVGQQGFLTASSLNGYATENWVTQRGYATQTWVGQQGFLTAETDPTVPSWAKAQSKPSYSLSEITSAADVQAIEALTGTGILTRTGTNTWSLDTNSYLTDRGYIGTTAIQASSAKQALAGITQIGLISSSGLTPAGTLKPITIGSSSIVPKYGLRWTYQYLDQSSINPTLTTVNKTIAFTDDIPTPYKLYFGSTSSENYYDTTAQKVLDASLINGVTLTTAQTITGRKTFSESSGGIMMSGANILTATDSTNQIGAVDSRFQNAYIRNVFLTYLGFRSDDGQTQVGNLGMGSGYAQIAIATGNDTSSVYSFNATYGFFHGGDGDVPCGRSDHRWSYVYGENADLSGDILVGGDIVPAADITSSLGYSGRRFTSGNIVNIHTRNVYFKHQTTGKMDGLIAGGDGYFRIRTGADIETAYKDIVFHETYGFYPEQSGVNLGYGSAAQYRWANIYGVNADLSGDLALAATSHIDIGPLRLEYNSTAKALHVTKVSNSDTNSYGLYADGQVAAGGVGGDNQYVRYVNCTQTEYNNLAPDPTTMYFIGSPVTKIYIGTALIFSEN